MKLFKRENYLKKIRGFYHEDDIIKVITGIRRCGKSSLMETIAEEFRASGISQDNGQSGDGSPIGLKPQSENRPLIDLRLE